MSTPFPWRSPAVGNPAVRLCHTSEHDVGGPFISFNALVGHRSFSWRLYRLTVHADTRNDIGFRRGADGFVTFTYWRLGFKQSSLHHIMRVLQPIPLHVVRFLLRYWYAFVPLVFQRQVSQLTQERSSKFFLTVSGM